MNEKHLSECTKLDWVKDKIMLTPEVEKAIGLEETPLQPEGLQFPQIYQKTHWCAKQLINV